jgi:hypothetical protein
LSRDKRPLRADFVLFFSAVEMLASLSSGNVFCLEFSRLVRHLWRCTTHVLRVDRHYYDGCRELSPSFLRPRNISVPSYRPLQKKGDTFRCASEGQARGRGSTQQPAKTFAIWTGARAGVQSHAQGPGTVPLCSIAFVDARGLGCQSTDARLSPSRPREAAGSPAPLPSLWRHFSVSKAVVRFSI